MKLYDVAKSRDLTAEELKQEQEELTRLRREMRNLKEEVDILKKAAAYFTRKTK